MTKIVRVAAPASAKHPRVPWNWFGGRKERFLVGAHVTNPDRHFYTAGPASSRRDAKAEARGLAADYGPCALVFIQDNRRRSVSFFRVPA